MPNNTTVNKVIINGVTKIDLTGDTATPSDVAQGKTFHDAAGILQTGTASGGGGDSWSWMGKNPTKITTLLNEKEFLKDTGFATWTPSTSSKNIVSGRMQPTQALNKLTNDYVVFVKFHSHLDYNEGTSGTYMITDGYFSYAYFVYFKYNSISDMTNDATNSYDVLNSPIIGGIFYKDSGGVDAYATNKNGIYINSVPTFQWDIGGAIGFGFHVNSPTVYAKCSGIYFSTANCALVNKNTSYYELKMEFWKVDHQTTEYGALYKIIHDMWVNGF